MDDQEEMDRRLAARQGQAAPPGGGGRSGGTARNAATRQVSKSGKKEFRGLVVLVAIGAAAYYWYFGERSEAPIQPNTAFVVGTQTPIPAAEAHLVDIVESYAGQYNTAQNDMSRGATRPARARDICRVLPSSLAVTNWIGQISTLSSNEQGKGVLDLKVSDRMSVGTWNNAFSDIEANTLIPTDSPLFATVSAMKVGDLVRFSGGFLPSANDCINEQSLTMEGGMTEPTFTFRFTSVAPLQTGDQ